MKTSIVRFLIPTTTLALAVGLATACGDDAGLPTLPADTQGADDAGAGDAGKTDPGNQADANTGTDAGDKTDADTNSDAGNTDAGDAADAALPTFTVGGAVTGLLGQGLVLQNGGADDLAQAADGTFTFATAVETGKPYAVTVKTQPATPSQTCTVTDGAGTIGTANVTNVAIACATNSYDVGGTVTGLPAGATVVLTNSGADDLSVTTNAAFTFATKVASGAAYEVAVKTQPAGSYCTVADGAGTVGGAAIANVNVTCAAVTSCKAIKALAPTAADGKYSLTGTAGAFDAYCDMTTDGGGWTLALKAGAASAAFAYDAAAWTDTTTLNETSTDLTANEAKFASFSTVAFTDVRVVFDTAGALNAVTLPQTSPSLQALFSGGAYVPKAAGRLTWMNAVPGSGLQVNCNQEGFNVGNTYTRVRVGIIGNQENDCGSPDSFVGFGGAGAQCLTGFTPAVGNKGSCDPYNSAGLAVPAGTVTSFGYLFVR